MKRKHKFISLQEAYDKLKTDKFRFSSYAVLTADDGWASLKNILPWLKEQNIPVTLFLNPGYFDGCHFRERETEKYLLKEDVQLICNTYSNVSIGMHGWEHVRSTEQSESEFRTSVEKTREALSVYPCSIPFFAYTYGRYNKMSEMVLKEHGIVPVMMDNGKNYMDVSRIHRELLDGVIL